MIGLEEEDGQKEGSRNRPKRGWVQTAGTTRSWEASSEELLEVERTSAGSSSPTGRLRNAPTGRDIRARTSRLHAATGHLLEVCT